MYFGDNDYSYSKTTHKACDPPQIIADVISKINLKYPSKQVNSCLVTRYLDGNQSCPLHSDDEDEIDPNSNIYTISIGCQRKMFFVDKANPNEASEIIELPEGSMLVFSRVSQDVWKHSIPPQFDAHSTRHSLTFRYVAPGFVNSTVICGDSNTKFLNFGDSKDSFGKWMPGRRIECFKIDQIPAPRDIGPYKNIVLNVGINDIKHADPTSIPHLIHNMELKCKAIHDVYPKSKIFCAYLISLE